MFAAAGESVSLSCSNTSSLGEGGSVKWAAGGRTLPDDITPYKGQTGAFHVSKGSSSLVISEVSALHAGDYQCSESTAQQKVFNKIRLHTLDGERENSKTTWSLNRAALTFSVAAVKTFPLVSVHAVTSEGEPGGDNLTLTCVLTCTRECEKDFSLTWSGSGKNSWQSGLMNVNNTLRNKLVLPALSVASDELSCLVLREGDVMASKKWRTVNCEYAPRYCCLFS